MQVQDCNNCHSRVIFWQCNEQRHCCHLVHPWGIALIPSDTTKASGFWEHFLSGSFQPQRTLLYSKEQKIACEAISTLGFFFPPKSQVSVLFLLRFSKGNLHTVWRCRFLKRIQHYHELCHTASVIEGDIKNIYIKKEKVVFFWKINFFIIFSCIFHECFKQSSYVWISKTLAPK